MPQDILCGLVYRLLGSLTCSHPLIISIALLSLHGTVRSFAAHRSYDLADRGMHVNDKPIEGTADISKVFNHPGTLGSNVANIAGNSIAYGPTDEQISQYTHF